MYKKGLYVLMRLTGVIIVFILLYLGLKYTFSLLYPFFIAFGLAMLLHPFVTFLENHWKIPRTLATLSMMLLLFVMLSGMTYILVTELIQGTAFLAEKVPTHFQSFVTILHHYLNEKIIPFFHKLASFFKTLNPPQQNIINDYIQQLTSQIGSAGAMFFQKTFLAVPTILSYIPQSLTVFFFIILATFLLTKDLPMIRGKLQAILPQTTRTSTVHILQHLRHLLFGYIKAQLTIVTITALMIIIGLMVIQMDHALTIAVLVAFVDLLPFIGTGIVFIPWLLYAFLVGNYLLTIQLSLLYSIIIIVRQFIEPKILSNHLGVRPLITLIVMFIGLQLWGVIGIIIAPFLIVLYNAFERAGVIQQVIQFVKG